MKKHEWRERTEDGVLRKVRAMHHAGRWRLQQRLAGDDGWSDLEPPPRADLQTLLEVLAGKYQRGRLPLGQLQQVEQLLAAASTTSPRRHSGR